MVGKASPISLYKLDVNIFETIQIDDITSGTRGLVVSSLDSFAWWQNPVLIKLYDMFYFFLP